MRKIAHEANLKDQSLITSTRFHKHIATMPQLFSLKENELDVLATFLAHDIKIHREFYRLPEKTVILGKVSKILLAAEKGLIHKYKGKSLDEINIEDDSDSGFEILDTKTSEISISRSEIHTASTPKSNEKELEQIHTQKKEFQ